MMHFHTPLTIFFVLAVSASGQTTRYVATTGSDGSDCTIQANPCATIAWAINEAEAGDTIEIANGVYTETVEIDKSLTLNGESEAGTIIQAHAQPGQASSRVITIDGDDDVAISNVTIRHGVASGSFPDIDGGGIYNNGGLDLTDVTLMLNEARHGAGLYNITGSGALSNVTFSNNEASGVGGGMYNINASPSLTNVVFIENEAGLWAGGMANHLNNSFPILTNVEFYDNHAELGGGMYNQGAPSLTDVTFVGNVADLYGGGMANFGSTAAGDLIGVVFSENEALRGGGLSNIEGSSPTLNDVLFETNTAERGGGMYNDSLSAPSLTDVTFDTNVAGTSGGGMENTRNSSPSLNEVSFTGNSAGAFGGGMTNVESSPTLSDVTFTANEAPEGGGLHNFNDSSPTLEDVVFTDNQADLGAGMYNEAESSPTLTNVLFNDNVALDFGGGVYNLNASAPAFANVAILNNTGGGIWNVDSSPSLTNVVITGNTGVGLYNSGGSPTLLNVTVSGNSSPAGGGGIGNFFGSDVTLYNTIVWGNEAVGNGDEIYTDAGSSIDLHHSLYADGSGDIGGTGDFTTHLSLTVDPLFVDEENGDLRLTAGSPAIDNGDPDTQPSDFPVDQDGDPIDLDGNPRFFGSDIDMGAYEHQGTIADEPSPEGVTEVLGAPRPNPVRGSTSLTLRVAEAQHVTVEVFDALGRRVQMLYDGALAAGTTETITLDASTLPAGVYAIRATGEDFSKTQRVTVMR